MYTITGTTIKLGEDTVKLEDAIAQCNAYEQQLAELKEEKEKKDKEILEVKTLNAKLATQRTGTHETMESSLTSLFNDMNGVIQNDRK